MRHTDIPDWIRASLAFNAAARDALDEIKRQLAARHAAQEAKYNPRWREQPRAPRGTQEGGRWTDRSSKPATSAPKGGGSSSSRRGAGSNRPPMESLFQLNPGLRDNPVWAIPLAPVDGFLGVSDAAAGAVRDAYVNMRAGLLRQIRDLDPSYQPRASLQSGAFSEMSPEGQANIVASLRADYAATLYRVRGETAPLQVETFRLLQRGADYYYQEGMRLYSQGTLEPSLTQELAVGRHVDRSNRRDLNAFYRRNGLDFGRHSQVRVNNRDYSSSGDERTFRIPDARVGNVSYDTTISYKAANDSQIRGFFSADARPQAVIVVRPRALGGSYWIPREAAAGGD